MQPQPGCEEICSSPAIGHHGLCELRRDDQKTTASGWAYDDLMYCYVLSWVASFFLYSGPFIMIQIVYLIAFVP